MRQSIQVLLTSIVCLGLPAAALAGDPAAGKKKTTTCVACHGQKGIATAPNYPNLAGQNEKYLIDALKGYKSGARNNPIMKPMVAPLSDTDIENIAAYYSSLDCK